MTDMADIISIFRDAHDEALSQDESEYRATREGIKAVEPLITSKLLEGIRAEIENLKKALSFYRDNWNVTKQDDKLIRIPSKELLTDGGEEARKALKNTGV